MHIIFYFWQSAVLLPVPSVIQAFWPCRIYFLVVLVMFFLVIRLFSFLIIRFFFHQQLVFWRKLRVQGRYKDSNNNNNNNSKCGKQRKKRQHHGPSKLDWAVCELLVWSWQSCHVKIWERTPIIIINRHIRPLKYQRWSPPNLNKRLELHILWVFKDREIFNFTNP